MGSEVADDPTDDIEVPQGWFATGLSHEVPGDALYVGRWRDRCAWVLPGKTDGLTEFTLAVLAVVKLKPGERNFQMDVIPD